MSDAARCAEHPLGPGGYVARIEWKEQMSKKHKCTKCPVCGLYAVWTPKAQPGEPNE